LLYSKIASYNTQNIPFAGRWTNSWWNLHHNRWQSYFFTKE